MNTMTNTQYRISVQTYLPYILPYIMTNTEYMMINTQQTCLVDYIVQSDIIRI